MKIIQLNFLILVKIIIVVKSIDPNCNTHDGLWGVCIEASRCQSLMKLYRKDPTSQHAINILTANRENCGNKRIGRYSLICCSDDVSQLVTTTTPPLMPESLGNACRTPDDKNGYCTNVRKCQSVLTTFIQRQKDPEYIQYIRQSNANCNYALHSICCPIPDRRNNSINATLLMPSERCGVSETRHDRIIGGVPADKDYINYFRWPWMALVGYTSSIGEVSFKCGGSIITKRHILTAAHCIRKDLTTVRLGEHDLSTDSEAEHVDIPVTNIIKYPKYDKRDGRGDLAILVLADDIQFTSFISPICIPFTEPEKSRDYVGYTPFVAGWGRTQEGGKSANVLQQLQLPVVSNQQCRANYEAIGRVFDDKQFDDAVMCAGYDEGGKGENCYTNDNYLGVCVELPRCRSLIQLYRRDQSQQTINILISNQRNCGNRRVGRNPLMCCSDGVPQATTTPPTPPPTAPPTSAPLGDACNTPDNIYGYCIDVRKCQSVLTTFIQRQKDPEYIQYIRQSNANCNYASQSICCPRDNANPTTSRPVQPVQRPDETQPAQPNSAVSSRLLLPSEGCGISKVPHNRVVGGVPAKKGEWPWMALVGYTSSIGEVSFKCGGSIITKRHILTAAHCIRKDLTTVRLGEHDLSTDSEAEHVDIPVTNIIQYPKYEKKYGHGDLAILVLGDDIQFTSLISPICIPFTEPEKSKDYVGYTPFVAGWGRTQEGGKSANVLQELQLPVISNQQCKANYEAIGKFIDEKQFDDAVMCAGYNEGEIEACSQILQSILQICENLIKMHKNSSDGNLYSKEYSHDNLITRNAKVISQVGFYGRAIGFQYCDSMKPILRFLAVSMASFSEQYFSNGNKLLRSTNSLFAHSKYFLDPENCAQRIVNISHNADINFCKSYWFLAEGKLMHSLPGIVGYKVDVNKVFKIPPEPLQIYSEKHNKNIDIPLPTSHIGLGSVSCRLLSAKRRQGMVGEKSFSENSLEPSKYLIIHSHGGGWVAQSSKSHEFYLREWAVKMDIPILSIDYSLAPEAPFPRGLEEVFYTYCWILKNVELLGSTGEHIVFAGDSAGGNLNTACIVKCIDMGIRTPKGIFNAYSPFLVNFASTPARFLSFVDPLLPYGFIMRVFKSYGASKADENIQNVPLSKNNKIHHELVEEVRDDNQDENALISSDSSKTLEAMWQKIKNNTEENEWQTNLGSIRETPSEEPTSPFLFPQVENDDDDALEMKISSRPQEQKKDETMSGFLEKVEHGTIEESKPRDRIGSRTLSEDNIVIDALSLQNFQERFQKATSTFVNAITTPFKPTNESSLKTIPKLQNNLIPQAPDDEFVFTVPKNPYLSPYLASDDILKQFPPTRILTTIVDPCLDDCVEFSKKLRNLNVDIKLDIVEGVNHGFLNFAQQVVVEIKNNEEYFSKYIELIKVITDNLKFFVSNGEGNDTFEISQSFQQLLDQTTNIQTVLQKINSFASEYDLDKDTPGNGYRSFTLVVQSAELSTIEICKNVKDNREKVFAKIDFYIEEILTYNNIFKNLNIIGESLIKSHNEKSGRKNLFSEVGEFKNTIRETVDKIDQTAFYGRAIAFHLPQSLQPLIKQIAAFTSAYSEVFYSNENTFMKYVRFPQLFFKYLLNADLSAQRIVEVYENYGLDMGRSMFLLSETRLYGIYQEFSEPSIQVNRVFQIQPEPLQIFSTTKKSLIDIKVPSSHIETKPINVRVFSSRYRKGMQIPKKSKESADEITKYLIIHAHGGGWFTQSSKFHGSYLKEWALKLNVPIVSIDFTSSVKAPFPRALEEIFYAYCWILKNSEMFGSTGEDIVLVGDSAGANLMTACTIKCIETGVQIPKGLFSIYGVFLANYMNTPSRFLCTLDVILPYMLYMRIFYAYNGIMREKDVVIKNGQIPKAPADEFDEKLSDDFLISPHYVPEEILKKFPKTNLLTTTFDPCLDESVEFAKRLKKAGIDFHLDILDGLNHGFLNFSQMSTLNIENDRIDELNQLLTDAINYFNNNVKHQTLKFCLNNLQNSVKKCTKLVEEIATFAHEYDFDEATQGNGYRSFLNVFSSAVRKTTKISQQLIRERENILFRADNYANDLSEWNDIFTALSQVCEALIEVHQKDDERSLYNHCDTFDSILTKTSQNINEKPFYGKNIGFQFVPSMRPIIKFIVVSMASYYSFYFKSKPKALKVLRFPISFSKYHLHPSKRAKKYLHASQNSTTEYCRSFWFLQEGKIFHTVPSAMARKVEVNKIFKILPEPLHIFSERDNKMVEIQLPTSHIGLAPISCRLMSAKKRKGMFGKTKASSAELSRHLIFHVHGGGWAAQTSKSHETYLREWASKLDVPILSVDYSLAPEAPFPRAIEEIFYAYCWALQNPEFVGSTGEHIVFVGDSAGGNLNTACVIQCIEHGIRLPKGLFNIYAPYLVAFTVVPSRFLSLVDPILPYGFTTRLFKSYGAKQEKVDANYVNDTEKNVKSKKKKAKKQRIIYESLAHEFDVDVHDSPLLSPYLASDEILSQFPTTRMLSTNLDPCLDDSIELGKRLKKLNVDVGVEILHGLAHGFLHFTLMSKDCHDGSMACLKHIKNLLEIE
ncbi:CLUMA_CG013865, isoform A [Clunio marinus]|uniref:Hormone-sensitive lipase n=1 Tax=Clunio marinus TaxID=568069 RepID=A0A1J1IK35_9DIPT|nr:CLUMA_CG013865, isoform A [Clunio marinus]